MKRFILTIFLFFAFYVNAHSIFKHNPFNSWETIHTTNFFVHYPKGYSEIAKKIAEICEDVYEPVSMSVRYHPGKTHVIIHTQSDEINDFMSAFPWRMEIFLTEPQDNWMGSGDDFFRVLITHEFTHIAHMRKKEGLTELTYYLLGDYSFLWHKLTPLWFQEGVAVYNETDLTNGGRGRNPRFSMQFDASIYPRQKSLYSTSYLSRIEYPVGMWYSSGYEMYDYVINQHGSDVWANILNDYTFLPCCGLNYHVRKITSKNLESHYRDIARQNRSKYNNVYSDETDYIITKSRDKQMHLSPIWSSDSTVLFHKKGLAELPEVIEIDLKNGKQKRVFKKDFYYETNSFAVKDGVIAYSYLSSNPIYSAVSYNDIYTYNIKSGKKERITKRRNINSPTFHPFENKVVAVESLFPYNQVVEVSLETSDVKPIFKIEKASVLNPKYSPCGEFITFTLSDENGITEIAVFSINERSYRKISNSGFYHVNNPVWSPDGRFVYYNGTHNGRFSIMRVDFERGVEEFGFSTLFGVESVDISKNGEFLVYSQYTKDGFRIAVKRVSDIAFNDVLRENNRSEKTLVSDTFRNELTNYEIKRYSPFPTAITPQGWHPLINEDVDGILYGLHAISNDALGRHSWSLNALRRFGEEPRNFGRFDYEYKRFWPEVGFSYENMLYPQRVDIENSIRDTTAYWENINGFEGFLYFPVTLSRGVFSSRFNFLLGMENKKIEYISDYYNMQPGVFDLSSVYSQVSFSYLSATIRNIVPYSGINTDLIYYRTADFLNFKSDFQGDAIFGNAQLFYTPPVLSDFQFEIALRSLKRDGTYRYTFSQSTLPWGYSGSQDNREAVFKTAIHYPLLFLEAKVPFLPIYMDFLGVEFFSELGTSTSTDISIIDSYNENTLSSRGLKFYLDLKVFGLFDFRPGISFYMLDDNLIYRSYFID